MHGVDVSSYQSALMLGNIPYDFVLVKATEGTGYVNPYCDMHYQQAKAAGKKRGVYHFASFGDPIAEANAFVDACIGYIHDAIFVLDWEGAGVGNVGWALRFLQHVEGRIGYKPAIYMSEWVENNYNWSPVVAGDYGLWMARYADYEIDNGYDMTNAGQAPVAKYWPFYFMWQWTSKGRINGYAGDLDCNIAYLDGAGWDRYAGATVQPAPVPVPPATTTTTTELPPAPEPTTTTTTAVPDPPVVEPNPSPTPGTATTTTTSAAPAPRPEPGRPSEPSLGAALVTLFVVLIKLLQGKK